MNQAEQHYKRALHLREHQGSNNLLVIEPLSGLANLFQLQGKYDEALSLAERALGISERILGNTHPKTVVRRAFYAQLLQEKQGTID